MRKNFFICYGFSAQKAGQDSGHGLYLNDGDDSGRQIGVSPAGSIQITNKRQTYYGF